MKKEEMFDLLGGIDLKYQREADAFAENSDKVKRQKKATVLSFILPAAALVAMLTLVLTVTLPLFTAPKGSDGTGVPPLSQGADESPLPEQYKNLTYVKHEDHVEISFLVEDEVAEIPETIEGLPVTEVNLVKDETEPSPDFLEIRANSRRLTVLNLPANFKCSLTLGKDVGEIEPLLLRNPGIVCVSVSEENSRYASIDGILYSKDLETLIACPAGSELVRLTVEPSKDKNSSLLPENLKRICESAFENCQSLVSVTLPKGLESMESSAFFGCETLTEIYLPFTLTYCAPDILTGCDALSYLRTSLTMQALESFHLLLSENTLIFAALPESVDAELLKEAVKLFESAEEIYSWFSLFNNIPCDAGVIYDDRFLVLTKGLDTIEDLQNLLLQYFTEEFSDLPTREEDGEPLFIEHDGALYVLPTAILAEYNAGERDYALLENSDGTLTLILRITLPNGTTYITEDLFYTLVKTEDGLRLTSPFTLPAEVWYTLYI